MARAVAFETNEHEKNPFIHLKIHRIFYFVSSTEHNNVLSLQELIYRQSTSCSRNISLLSNRFNNLSSPSTIRRLARMQAHEKNPDYSID